MPITATNPFRGRQYPGDVVLQTVRSYLRCSLAYEHVVALILLRRVEDIPEAAIREITRVLMTDRAFQLVSVSSTKIYRMLTSAS